MLTVSKGAAYSAGGDARGRHGVEQPGAVEVQPQAVPVAELAHGAHVLERQHDAAAVVVRVLEAHQPRGREVHVGVGVDVLLHLLEVERAVGRIEAAQLHVAERRGAALLVEHDVRLGVQEDLVAAARERAHGRLVAHRAGGEVEAGLLAEQAGGVLLQADDRGVVAEHVVADLGLEHGAAHLRRRTRDGVAAQVDRLHVTFLGWETRRARPPRAGYTRCGRRRGPRRGSRPGALFASPARAHPARAASPLPAEQHARARSTAG